MANNKYRHPPAGYDEMSVDDVENWLSSVEDPARVRKLKEYESANKDRKTAKAAMDERLGALASADTASEPARVDTGSDDTGEGVPPKARDAASDAARVPSPDDIEEKWVEAPTDGYYGGLWFDDAGLRKVRYTTRVEEACEHGDLILREDYQPRRRN